MWLQNERMEKMVDGVSGVGTGVNIDALKEIIQDVVEETLEAKEAQNAQAVEESADEEYTLVDEGDTGDQAEEKVSTTTDSGQAESLNASGLTGLLSAISTMLTTMMESMVKMLGVGQTDQAAANSQTSSDGIYQMSADEKAFLTLNPDFLRNLVAKEKFEAKYGESYADATSSGSKLSRHIADVKLDHLKSQVTDEEMQAYLQLNPDVIKNAIEVQNNFKLASLNSL